MEDEKKENKNSKWDPYSYLVGAAACVVAGPYVGVCFFAASKVYETMQTAEPKQTLKPKS